MTEISNLITQLGFPIVACVGLGVFVKQQINANREDNQKREDKLYEEIKYNREVNKTVLETNKTLANDINNKLDKLIKDKEVE